MCQTNLHKDDYLLIKENQLDKWPIIAESKNIRGVRNALLLLLALSMRTWCENEYAADLELTFLWDLE